MKTQEPWSFCIITGGGPSEALNNLIESIRSQKIPNYEIVIVGGNEIKAEDIRHFTFDDSLRKGWITRKKNIAMQQAKYENLCIMHDYLYLMEGWYEGYNSHGYDWQVSVTQILNLDLTRYRDWCVVDHPGIGMAVIPYDTRSDFMYISGAYWCAKKSFMDQYPLNERLLWGEGEDIEWSKRVRKTIQFDLNLDSRVKIQKQKEVEIPIVENLPTAEKSFKTRTREFGSWLVFQCFQNIWWNLRKGNH